MEFSKFVKWITAFVFVLGGIVLAIVPQRFDERVVTIVVGCTMVIVGLSSIPINKKEEQEVK